MSNINRSNEPKFVFAYYTLYLVGYVLVLLMELEGHVTWKS